MAKLRILCLHGYRQTGSKFRGKTAAIRKAVKAIAEFVYVDGPIVLPYEPTTIHHQQQEAPTEPVKQFAWFNINRDEDGNVSYSGIEDSIEYLQQIWKAQGPFDGVFGFSQGGMLASILFALKQRQNLPFDFKFGVFVSARWPCDVQYCVQHGFDESIKVADLPSCHIIGSQDELVPAEESHALALRFSSPVVIEHPGGHYIPATKDIRMAFKTFLQEQVETTQEIKED